MGLTSKIKSWLGRPRKQKLLPGTPSARVVAKRITQPEGLTDGITSQIRDLQVIYPTFPWRTYEIIEKVSIFDPYISEHIHNIIALGNPGHKLFIQAPSEARATEAIDCANQFAARCFPYGGGADGLLNSMLFQGATFCAMAVEWCPDKGLNQVQEGVIIPIKSLRFRYRADGTLELCQQQSMGEMVPLPPVQTSYHGIVIRDNNPYPVPIILSALRASVTQRKIMAQIETWVEKVSGLGVLIASIEPPPREPAETQAQYDTKAQAYLDALAETISGNLNSGLGIGYNNIDFKFHTTQAGAQGARDLLQVALQGLFAALNTHPIWFGWDFGSTETLAKVVYQKMLQSLKIYQLGAKRTMEAGHRLNFALSGMGDVGVTFRFNQDQTVDLFKDAEAAMMKTSAVVQQLTSEPPIIDRIEARRLLGHEDKSVEAGAYVAAFNRGDNEYRLLPRATQQWTGVEVKKKQDEEGVNNEENKEAA